MPGGGNLPSLALLCGAHWWPFGEVGCMGHPGRERCGEDRRRGPPSSSSHVTRMGNGGGPWVPTFSIRLASCNSDTDPFKGTLRALVTQELRCWGRVCGQSPEQHGHRHAPREGTGHRCRGRTVGCSHMVDFLLEDSGGWGSGSWPHVCVPGNSLHTCAGWEGTAGPRGPRVDSAVVLAA